METTKQKPTLADAIGTAIKENSEQFFLIGENAGPHNPDQPYRFVYFGEYEMLADTIPAAVAQLPLAVRKRIADLILEGLLVEVQKHIDAEQPRIARLDS